jgi:molecular chaperone DnaJ
MITEPHKVLGVPENATQDEIKKAYRQMAKKYHPDLNPGDEIAAQKMNEVNEAYDMLMNPDKYRKQQTASYSGYGQGGYNTYGGQQGRTYRTYTWGGPFGGWTYTNVDFDDFFGGYTSNDFLNPKVEPNDNYNIERTVLEIKIGVG